MSFLWSRKGQDTHGPRAGFNRRLTHSSVAVHKLERRAKDKKDGRLSKHKQQTHDKELPALWIITPFGIMTQARRGKNEKTEHRRGLEISKKETCQAKIGKSQTTAREAYSKLSNTQVYASLCLREEMDGEEEDGEQTQRLVHLMPQRRLLL